jgi:tyrosine-specific transport protein
MAGGDITADPLSIISEDLGGSASVLLSLFGVSAIGTSFIGVSLGMSEYLMPFMENALSGLDEPEEEARLTRALYEAMNTYEDEKPSGLPSVSRVLTFAAFLSVPLFVAEQCPNIFLPVTNFVGAYGMTTLYGVMPPIMAYTMRQERRESRRADPFAPLALRFKTNTLLPGGRLTLSALSLSAVAIALSKVYEDISVVSGSGVDSPLAVGKLAELVADVASAVPL